MNKLSYLSSFLRDGRMGDAASLFLKNMDYLPILMKTIKELKGDLYKSNYEQPPLSNPFSSPEEREDIIERADWLISEVMVEPQALIDKMPKVIGRQYMGQWAIYACSNTIKALSNIVRIYPDKFQDYAGPMRKILEMILSPEIRYYDTMQWKEDALETLDGNKSHMTYLSILAWSIGNYRMAVNDSSFDALHSKLCATLARRMKRAKYLNLPSFPNRIVFFPDMMFSVMCLKDYSSLYNGEYDALVDEWVKTQAENFTDPHTGLLISKYYPGSKRKSKLSGAYTGLNTASLCILDERYAFDQYQRMKKYFTRGNKYVAIKEFQFKSPEFSFDIDAGPIIQGVSPSGTAFALGAATYFQDWDFRAGLLRTAELAGHTVSRNGKRHYKLAEIMLTGEAITLAMRTTLKFQIPKVK